MDHRSLHKKPPPPSYLPLSQPKSSSRASQVPSTSISHPIPLDQARRRALDEIDNAQFGWNHVRAVLISGVGFFTDAYDIFAINIASTMLGYVLNQGGTLSSDYELGIKVATPIGTFCGQILFGWLADVYGRKSIYGSELIIITFSTLGQALSSSKMMIGWRFLLGIGIGGDYPLSACITSEVAAVKIRGRMMTAVFASQGFGQLAAALVSLFVVRAFENPIRSDSIPGASVDTCWRLLIGLGAIPAACALYFRLTIPESPRYQMELGKSIEEVEEDSRAFLGGEGEEEEDRSADRQPEEDCSHKYLDQIPKFDSGSERAFWKHYGQWKNFKVLFGCAWSWFALDLAFYGLGLNSSIVLRAIGFGQSLQGTTNDQIYQSLVNVSVGNIVLSVAGLIPGYWVAFAFIDNWGRKPIQIMGFAVLTCLFIIMGFGYHQLVDHHLTIFVVLYCLSNFFQNFGPNTTTFVIPAECFPTRYRSTSHGISAASGKLGAIVAQMGFAGLKDIGGKDQFIDRIFIIFSGCMFSGLLSSFLVPETKGKSLEELSGEDSGSKVIREQRVASMDLDHQPQ